MELLDHWGAPAQASVSEALATLDQATLSLVAMVGDPGAQAADAAAADGELLLASLTQAYLSLYATSDAGIQAAREILERIEPAIATAPARERMHHAAASAWAAGHWESAAQRLDAVLVRFPRDLLALRVAQDLYYFMGNARDLRDVVARVVRSWPPAQPGWAWVQGMYAFGLEEAGDYRRAETAARAALARNPRDMYAVHALAHVFEMEGRQEEGIAFLTATVADWRDSYFANHNWVHKALYHLELLDFAALLPLYDEQIRGQRPVRWVPVVDAASVLWRLMLFGTDGGDRARALVDGVRALRTTPVYAFNDWHALMIFALANRADLVDEVLTSTRTAPSGTTNRRVLERAGFDLLEGFAAFSRGDHAVAVDRLITARPVANVIGGSHAQRDVIDLTLLAAAVRSGDDDLVRALYDERVERKPSAQPAADVLIAAQSAGASHAPPVTSGR